MIGMHRTHLLSKHLGKLSSTLSDVGSAISTQTYSNIVKRFVFWPIETEQCFCCSFSWFNSVRYGGYAVMQLTPWKIMSKFSLDMRLRSPWLKLTCSRRRSDMFKCLYFPKVSSSDSLPRLGSKCILLANSLLDPPNRCSGDCRGSCGSCVTSR